MIKSGLRTTTALLLCAAAVGPSVAAARPNDGGFSRSIESGWSRMYGVNCGASKDYYDISQEFVQQDIAEGDYTAAFQHVDDAAEARTNARADHCAWAWT